jgi:hypothetical protein
MNINLPTVYWTSEWSFPDPREKIPDLDPTSYQIKGYGFKAFSVPVPTVPATLKRALVSIKYL